VIQNKQSTRVQKVNPKMEVFEHNSMGWADCVPFLFGCALCAIYLTFASNEVFL
jgi:hypothetical protein